jgi:hypothetical protein
MEMHGKNLSARRNCSYLKKYKPPANQMAMAMIFLQRRLFKNKKLLLNIRQLANKKPDISTLIG